MISATIDKSEVLRRADAVRHTQLFDPATDEYVAGFVSQPVGKWKYRQQEIEPVVEIDGFCDPSKDAWLTVNRYNAVVLNSRTMLITDIDFGDERLNPFARAKDVEEVIEGLDDLAILDNELLEHHIKVQFAQQSFRVYRTHSGCRVICTSLCFPHPGLFGYAAKRFMQFLKSDPQYIALCDDQDCYRARLTPKPWRDNGNGGNVCRLEEAIGVAVHPDLEMQLALHDEMTLSTSEYSSLA